MGGRSYGQSLKWKYLTEQTALYAHSKGNQLFLNKIPTPPHTPSVHKSTSTKPITKEPRNSLILCSIKNSIKIIKKKSKSNFDFLFSWWWGNRKRMGRTRWHRFWPNATRWWTMRLLTRSYRGLSLSHATALSSGTWPSSLSNCFLCTLSTTISLASWGNSTSM